LSKSSKYIDKLFREQWEREGMTPEEINKIKKKLCLSLLTEVSVTLCSCSKIIWSWDFKKMRNTHIQTTEHNMEKFKIKSASELLARASENIPEVKQKIGMDLTPEQDGEFTRLEGVDYAEEQFSDTWDNYQTFRAGQTMYSKGMNYAIYQIRVYGVIKKPTQVLINSIKKLYLSFKS